MPFARGDFHLMQGEGVSELVNRHPRANNYAPIARDGRACQLCLREIIANRRELAIDHGDLFVVNQNINRVARYLAFAEDKHHFGFRDDAHSVS